ncbi:MAG: hypothetical protein U0939_12935 [Pirellulales bacterium]
MADDSSAINLLQDLDARQDEVLAKLNELNAALETILKGYVDSQRAAREESAGVEATGESPVETAGAAAPAVPAWEAAKRAA